MLEQNVADGVHRIEDAHTNWYLVDDGAHLTVVDTGLPASWRSLQSALSELGRSQEDIEAVVLTHGHFDHMGFARRAQDELGVPIFVHEQDRGVAAHPWRYAHERARLGYLRHPKHAQILTEMTLMGALGVKGVESVRTYGDGEQLDVPGRPTVIATPGHTYGHSSLLLRDRGALLAGDAFVTLDPYTGRAGPCLVAGAATADSTMAMASLERIAGVDADVALTGHGGPWHGSLREAVDQAVAAGPA